jgi:hypothetical protein
MDRTTETRDRLILELARRDGREVDLHDVAYDLGRHYDEVMAEVLDLLRRKVIEQDGASDS